jgi:hypothetical protein
MSSPRAIVAESGSPGDPLPTTTSGVTPKVWAANIWPVRPKPAPRQDQEGTNLVADLA